MNVSQVHFNHDPLSMTSDAMTIRQNASGDWISTPEYELGRPPLPIAYASNPLSSQVTIKARFANGTPGSSAKIRAIDADVATEETGCLGALIIIVLIFLKSFNRGALGRVAERDVTFDGNGVSASETFQLAEHRLKDASIRTRTTRWIWQVRRESGWEEFDRTEHRVYVVLDAPRAPWNQQVLPVITPAFVPRDIAPIFINNTQLPWADALEVACSWASGTKSVHDAASAIVRGVNSRTPQVYDTLTHFGGFWLSQYLAQLRAGSPFLTNCTDCANAVTTLSNLLGCDLWEQYFSTPLELTKPFLTLNGNPSDESDWVQYIWSYHEFGWRGPAGTTGLVYDGCLQVDMDDDPDDSEHVPRHPTGMAFPGYKDRLWIAMGGLDPLQQRRSVY